MSIIIKYDETSPIFTDFPRGTPDAYFRGYKVGKVSKIALSKDQKYILFYLDIFYKNLRLPKNTIIELGTEDLYGAKHFAFYYPKKPSSDLISDGEIINGTRTDERLDKYLVNSLKRGELKELVSDLLYLTNFMTASVKKIDKTIDPKELNKIISELPNEIKSTTQSLKSLNVSIPETNENMNQAIKEISNASNNINTASKKITDVNNNISTASENILSTGKTVSKTNKIIPGATDSINTTNSILKSTNCNLSEVNAKIPEIPPNLLENSNSTILKANCLADKLVEILDKRFLLFRFMFGKPAISLKNCTESNNNCSNSIKNK